jgi:hypothetical protein
MRKLWFVMGCLLALPAFAGIAAVQGLPAAMAGVSGGSSNSSIACEKNCSVGDSQCLQACQNPVAAPKKAGVPDFPCLNQCTQLGYSYGYCKTVCAR